MKKRKNLKEIIKIVNQLRKKNKKIVFTNGCFDILHVGHIKLLKKAKQLGDILIVGVNKDSSVKKIKGEKRPVFNENERVEILSAIEYVDYIVLFGSPTPERIIKLLKPDVLVKGGDYKRHEIVGADFVEKHGGKVYIFPLIKNISTTAIIEKIKKL